MPKQWSGQDGGQDGSKKAKLRGLYGRFARKRLKRGTGGLGWFIFENRNQLETSAVFAGLLTVILIGLFVESVIFRTIENATVRKWGMQT